MIQIGLKTISILWGESGDVACFMEANISTSFIKQATPTEYCH